MKKILSAAALAAFAISGHATLTSSTTGSTTTLIENFDGGTSFTNVNGQSGGYAGWKDAPGTTDDYIHYQNGWWQSAQGSTLSFATVSSNSNVTVSFYYAFWNPNGGSTPPTISLDGSVQNLDFHSTGDFLNTTNNNPGPDSATDLAQADRPFTFSWSNVGAKVNHTLTFSTGAGSSRQLSVDDLKIVITPVPEPETYAMLLAGLGVMGAVARRRKAKQA